MTRIIHCQISGLAFSLKKIYILESVKTMFNDYGIQSWLRVFFAMSTCDETANCELYAERMTPSLSMT